MRPDPVPVPIQELLRQRAWLQGLARAIVRDPAAADDLEQETWVAALRSPPTRPHGVAGIRAWLGRVLRNRARDDHRARVRRGLHEAVAPPPRVALSAADMVERAETHRRVVEAVMGLDEPQRTAVVLRFFEGLPPREVALRTGVPAETARTRIGRGVDRLRAQLVGDVDPRARAELWAFALGLPHSGPVPSGGVLGAAASKGGLVAFTAKQAAAVGIALAAVVGGVLLVPRPRASEERVVPAAGTSGHAQARPELRGRAPSSLATAAQAEPLSVARSPVLLVVRREDGASVVGTTVAVEADGGVASARTVGLDGSLSLDAAEKPRTAYVAAPDTAPCRFALPAGAGRIELVVPVSATITGVVLVDGRVPTERVRLALRSSEPSIPPESLPTPSPVDPWSFAVTTDAQGAFRATGLPHAASVVFVPTEGFAVESPDVVTAPHSGVIVRLRRLPRLHGRILRGGAPLEGASATVPWTEGPTSGQVSTVSDPAGRFSLVLEGGASHGTTLVLTDAQGLARAERTLPAERTLDTDLGDLELEDPWAEVMRIEAVGHDGRPVAGAMATIPGDPSWRSAAAPADGLLELPARHPQADALVGGLRHRLREVAIAPTGGAAVRIVLDPAALLRIRVPRLGSGVEGAQVRVSGTGRIFDEPESHAALELREAVGGTHACTWVQAEECELAVFPVEREPTELIVPWVLPGRSVRIELRDGYGETLATMEARLQPGEERAVELTAESPARRIRGIVLGPRGSPVAGAQVIARAGASAEVSVDGLPGPLVAVTTDGAGQFTLEGVHAAALDLFVAAPRLTPWARRSVPLPRGDARLEVVLTPGRTLTVRLRGMAPSDLDVWAEPADPQSWTPGYRPWGGVLHADGSVQIDAPPDAPFDVVVRTAAGEVRARVPVGAAEVEVEVPRER